MFPRVYVIIKGFKEDVNERVQGKIDCNRKYYDRFPYTIYVTKALAAMKLYAMDILQFTQSGDEAL